MAKTYKDIVLETLTQKAKGKDFTLSQNRPAFLSGMDNALKEPGDVEQWPVDKLREHPENSRFFSPLTGTDFERLKADIQENGMHDAIIVTTHDGKEREQGDTLTVLSGHNRLNAARELGMITVPVRVIKFPRPEYAVRFMIRDNLLRRQLKPEQVKALIGELYGAELQKDGRGGDRGNQHTGGKVAKVTNELLAKPQPVSLSKRVSKELGISESTAKQHLAALRNPEGKTAQNRGKTASHASQEAPQRTQKGGERERVGGGKDAGGRLDTLAAAFIAEARSVRGLTFADIDKAVETIREALYGRIEGK